MLVGLTGTPGTGKGSVARGLKALGYRVVDLASYATRQGLADSTPEGLVLDLKAIALKMPPSPGGPVVLEGHLSHLLPVDLAIVLRCNPEALRSRLRARGWSEEKIRENVEAEAVDVILIEAMEHCSSVREVDTSRATVGETIQEVAGILEGRDRGHAPGFVDWSEVILSWY